MYPIYNRAIFHHVHYGMKGKNPGSTNIPLYSIFRSLHNHGWRMGPSKNPFTIYNRPITRGRVHSGKLTQLAGKWTLKEDVFPIEHGDIPLLCLFIYQRVYGCFQEYGYPQIIHFNRVFHYKLSILGYHYFWKHPYSSFIFVGGTHCKFPAGNLWPFFLEDHPI